MTPTPEAPAPQLLSEPRLAEIEIIGSVMRGPFADDYDAKAGQAIMDLLAHAAAQQAWFTIRDKELCEAFDDYRQQVAAELRALMQSEESKIVGMSSFELKPAPEIFAQNARLRAAAARLHLGEL